MRSEQMQRGFSLAGMATIFALALCPADRNILGVSGALISKVLMATSGLAAWLVPVFLADEAAGCFTSRRRFARRLKMVALMVLACIVCDLADGTGGKLGTVFGGALTHVLGIGAYLVTAAALFLACTHALGAARMQAARDAVGDYRARLAAAWQAAAEIEQQRHAVAVHAALPAPKPILAPVYDAIVIADDEPEPAAAFVAAQGAVPPPLPFRPTMTTAPVIEVPADGLPSPEIAPELKPESVAIVDDAAAEGAETKPVAYRLPSPALLALPPNQAPVLSEEHLKKVALRIEARLYEYGVKGDMTGTVPGPVVTNYEFNPRPGTKLSAIRKLAGELSMAMEQGVRIIAPLPNSGRVGIEVPHDEGDRAIIPLRALIESDEWQDFDAALPVVLGEDVRGAPVFADLATMPHLLVAGATGAGKTVGLHVMLTSLLLARKPTEVRLVMVDPKVVEFRRYADIPHLLTPIITETEDATRALVWAIGEMELRYRLFAKADTNDLTSYNAVAAESLPRIVIVVDEYADLVAVAKDDIEPHVARLAQKARAAGLHIILATQRPEVKVVSGQIKNNFPARIAYRVAQRVDSTTILDRGGAERLLGRGDMLALLPNSLDVQRFHSAFVSNDEVRAVCDFLRAESAPRYDESVFAASDAAANGRAGGDLYQQARAFVTQEGYCSVSALQRRFGIGYNKAAKIAERLDAEGLLGDRERPNGRRKVVAQANA